MREYIFTPHEREVLRRYLESGIKEKQVRTLLTRIKRSVNQLKEDLALIDRILKLN